MTQSSNRGTFSHHEQDDDLWQEKAIDRNVRRSPRTTRDQRKRPAQDAVLASARREREESAFLARFPEAAHIQISNYISRHRF